jgi:hypothetical protein
MPSILTVDPDSLLPEELKTMERSNLQHISMGDPHTGHLTGINYLI